TTFAVRFSAPSACARTALPLWVDDTRPTRSHTDASQDDAHAGLLSSVGAISRRRFEASPIASPDSSALDRELGADSAIPRRGEDARRERSVESADAEVAAHHPSRRAVP